MPQEYRPQGGMIATARMILLLSLGLHLMFLAIFVLSPEDRVPMLVLNLLVLPGLTLPALYLGYNVDHKLIVTDDAILQCTLWGETRLRFDEVTEVIERDRHIPYNMVLKGPHAAIRINRLTVNRFQLYEQLWRHIPALRAAEQATFPVTLRPGRHFWTRNVLPSTIAMTALMTFLSVAFMYTIPIPEHKIYGIYFLVGFACTIGLMQVLEAHPEDPVVVEISQDWVHARWIYGKQRRWPTQQVVRIEHTEAWARIKPGYDVEGVTRKVFLHFQDGSTIKVSEGRAGAWGYTLERLYGTLLALFGLRDDQLQAYQLIEQAKAHEEVEEWAAARQAYEQALQLWPEHEQLKVKIALRWHFTEDFAPAEPIWRELLESAPADAMLWAGLALSLEGQGRYEEALEAMEQALAIRPRSALYLRLGAALYAELDQQERAQSYLQRAIMEDPEEEQKAREDARLRPLLS